MSGGDITILSHWYFHLPNYVMAALMYTLLGRFILAMFVSPDWGNYIWRAFVTFTEPVVKVARLITPLAIATPLVVLLAALWLMALRVAFFVLMVRLGLAPGVGQAG